MGLFKKIIGSQCDWDQAYHESFRFDTTLLSAQRVFVLAAHPDDETLGCGGTIALHKRHGAEVQVLVFTDGSGISFQGSEDVGLLRRQEAQRVGEIIGVDEWHFLDLPDGSLQRHKRKALSALQDIASKYKPELIYAPSPMDFHPDHRTVFHVAVELFKNGVKNIALYEIYAPIRFNRLIDITDVISLKTEALTLYKTSLLGRPKHFIDALMGLNAYRRLLTPASDDDRFYEAFWHIDGSLGRREIIKWLTYGL